MDPVSRLRCEVPGLRVRLQSPALTSIMQTMTAPADERDDRIFWGGQIGGVVLDGVCFAPNPSFWYLDFTLKNSGPDAEVRLALPYLFYDFDQTQPARMFNPLFGGVLEPSTTPLRISYPGPASFCLTAAVGLESAVAVGLFNDDQRHVVIRHIPAGVDGQIRFVFERILVKTGETVELPRMFISMGVDWAEAMRPYREWFRVAFPRQRARPDWWVEGRYSETRQAHCLVPFNPPQSAVGVWIFDNEGNPRTFEQVRSEVDAAIRQGQEKGYQPLFYQFGWWQSMAELKGLFMFDSLCGDYVQAHDLARRVVEYIHRQGARTYFYTNAISAGDETEVYRAQPDLFARDASGFSYYNEGYPMVMFCPGSPGMRDYWEHILQYLLVELGVDGLFLDQVCGGAPPVYCYDPAHQHSHPDTYGRDFLALIEYIGQRARDLKPDCYLGGELVQDTRGVLLDEAHGYGYTGPHAGTPGEGLPPPEYYIFTRYLCPEIYSGVGHTSLALMNGAAGYHSDPLWSENRSIFESVCMPCPVETTGALAYLYGPHNGRAILAVRAAKDGEGVIVRLPCEVVLAGPAPDGMEVIAAGRLICSTGIEPKFFIIQAA